MSRTGPVPCCLFLPRLPPRSLSVGGASSSRVRLLHLSCQAFALTRSVCRLVPSAGSSGRVLPGCDICVQSSACRLLHRVSVIVRLQAPRVPVDRCTWPCTRPGFPSTSLPLSSGFFIRPQIVIWKQEGEALREKSRRALPSPCVRGPRLCLAPGSLFTHEAGAVTGAVRCERFAVGDSSPCERQSAHNLSVVLTSEKQRDRKLPRAAHLPKCLQGPGPGREPDLGLPCG